MDIVETLTNKPEPCRRYSAEDDALRSEAAATITALRARVAELERVGRETSEYLRKLEANMLENDADMMLDDCLPPSFHADQIDAALTRIKEAT